MKIIIIGPKTSSLIGFRGELIKEMISRGNEVVAITPDSGYEEEFKILGAKNIKIPFEKNSISLIENIRYFLNIRKILKDEKPDIVFPYTIKPVIFGSIAAKSLGVKKIYSLITGLGYVFIGNDIKVKILRIIVGFLYRISCLISTKIIFQNKDDKQEFIKRKYVKEMKCEVVNGSGVDMEYYKKSVLPSKINFLMIARIIKNKGVIEYLNACKIVKLKYANVTFSYIGAFDKTKDAIKCEDINTFFDDGTVDYIGETTDVRPYIANCSVYVLPSYREGIPRSILEAMSMGRPIITTNAIGCKETVEEGLNGFKVDIHSINQLVDRMEWMIKNKDSIFSMADKSYNICKERFEVKKVNNQMLKIMDI
ncbi:MAG: glycosyltransferase family 4 protein [Clostridia bacterium]|nr:glycosyltransferase family 4 protein [Clostridia bacterium]MDD4386500.1 glycosyltransferase family 4 protein [Clostridia bacterium]